MDVPSIHTQAQSSMPPMLGATGSPTRSHPLHLPYHPCLMPLEVTQKSGLHPTLRIG